MADPAAPLKEFRKEKDFFIGIDSDGCVFDSMEIKHKECFCPAFVNHYGLQPVSKYAREVWEFVNLYSETRGTNRFKAVLRSLELLAERPEVKARDAEIPSLPVLTAWVQRESKLGNPALKAEMEKTGDEELRLVYAWSLDVNAGVEKIVRNVPPFPLFRESLDLMAARADTIVVSQTPNEALIREWAEHRIDDKVSIIAGQEMGTKSEHLQMSAGGKYDPKKILMIGDAPGDHKAAQAVDALFYPVNPGAEEASWERFHAEALGKFFDGSFAGDYQKNLLAEFDRYLPEMPPWEA